MTQSHAGLLISGAFACLFVQGGPCAADGRGDTTQVRPNQVKMDQLKANPGETIELIPHHAIYELALSKSVGSKSPTAAHGRIAFDFAGSPCQGYMQNFRQLTELQPAEGPTRVSDMHSATFEDADGKSFEFKMQTKVDNDSADTIDGKAVKAGNGPLLVNLDKPKRDQLDLGDDVVFPTEHLKRIIAAAEGGKNMIEAKVFDG